MTVHSINTYKHNKYSTIKDLSESLAKLILHRKIVRYRVLAPAMVDYFMHKFPFKKVCFIPGSFYKRDAAFFELPEEFLIVVPGTISEKRRDYTLIIKIFTDNVKLYTSPKNIHLVLAGNGNSQYGKKIIGQLNSLTYSNPRFKVTSFLEHLSQDTFERFYRSAHIVLAPLQADTKSMRNESEINGTTHSPGFITDEIYMGKPAIIPEDIQMPYQFADCFWRYSDEQQLNSILLLLINQPHFINDKKKKLAEACEYFKQENFANEFKTLFDV